MNIEQIRAEILKVFTDEPYNIAPWILAYVDSYYQRSYIASGDEQVAACVLVDMAFEAGKDVGYKKGKADDFENHCDAIEETRQKWFESGYNEAAKDPKAWSFEDKNGNRMSLGDKVKTSDGILTIKRICADEEPMECRVLACDDNGGFEYKPWRIEKVIPDTWEKFAEDLSNQLVRAALGRLSEEEKSPDEIAEAFADRAREMLGDPGC